MMKGILIDCYQERNNIILWIKKDDENIRLVDAFIPKIYVKDNDIKGLREKLYSKGLRSFYTKKKSFFNKEVLVLEVPVFPLSNYRKFVRIIERTSDYKAEIYNADLKLEEYYMFEKDLFPTAIVYVKAKGDQVVSINAIDSPDKIYYEIPNFKISKLQVKTKDNLFKGFNTSIKAVTFNNKIYKRGEKEILLQLKKDFEKEDPDILWAENGNIILPFLKVKFRQYKIYFNFNRFEEDDIKYKKGDNFVSYGHVMYRTHSIFLKGRLHFDTTSFFADDVGFYGIIDGSRICRQRIQRTQMRSSGAAVTNYLIYTAFKNNFLLPYKIGLYERFKTLFDLYQADRGSLIFEPKVGFHTDVAEFDFVSLYPNIMNKFNLSPETLFCKCCKWNKVPYLHYHYCVNERGIVSIVAEKLIKRRIALKKINDNMSKEKCDFLKWLLVTMFGYQAFKNRKIGVIEAHESIQAYAREILLKAVRTAEEYDFEVIHGIIDSIYVEKKGFADSDIRMLTNEISHQTNMEVKHEGNYKWIVFLPSIVDGKIPVSSHFYGIFKSGEIKARGIDLRRRDTPKIIADMQQEMIEALSTAKDEEEFRSLFPEVYGILRRRIASLPYASKDDLMIIKTLSKLEYANDIAQKLIIKQMKKEGYDMQPGQTIAYIIKDINNSNPLKRYALVDSFNGKFDKQKYAELMIRAAFSLLQPFGITISYLTEKMKKSMQLKIENFINEEDYLNIKNVR